MLWGEQASELAAEALTRWYGSTVPPVTWGTASLTKKVEELARLFERVLDDQTQRFVNRLYGVLIAEKVSAAGTLASVALCFLRDGIRDTRLRSHRRCTTDRSTMSSAMPRK